jgi:hypothetical protein
LRTETRAAVNIWPQAVCRNSALIYGLGTP